MVDCLAQVTPSIARNLAWGRAFRKVAAGPWHGPGGPVPGTRLEIEHEADSYAAGMTVFF
jgi:hypothetical protein